MDGREYKNYRFNKSSGYNGHTTMGDGKGPGPSSVIQQYVSEVLSFSSHYGSDSSVSYTAYNLTGKPSNYPDYGDFPQAFVMRTYGVWWKNVPSKPDDYMPQNFPSVVSHDYIDVKFEMDVYPLAVKIYETHNPGAVVRIWAFDENPHQKRWSLLWEGHPERGDYVARIFNPSISRIEFKTRILRIEFNHSQLDYYTGLDAVLLEGRRNWVSTEKDFHIAQEVIKRKLHSISFNTQPLDLNQYLADYLRDTAKTNAVDRDCYEDGPDVSLERLPNETLLKIMGYLDLESLKSVSCVCQRLHALATDQLLYSRLSLKPYWNKITDYYLTHSLPSLCGRLQQLDLSWCGSYGLITPTAFESFVVLCCRNLTHIRLNCCSFVRNNTIKVIAQTCPNLLELGLKNCVDITEAGFLHLTSLSHITSLDLYRTCITGNSLLPILKANPNLQHLNIGSCTKIENMDEVARTLGTYNKRLRSLDLWKILNLSQAGVTALSMCPELQELDIGWSLRQSVPVESLTSLARGCPQLRKLFLTAVRGITDKDLEPFLENCPHLEQLDLMGVHSITADGCYRLLQHLSQLRLMDVSFCYQISDSMVEQWQPMFPRVALKFHSSVRYVSILR